MRLRRLWTFATTAVTAGMVKARRSRDDDRRMPHDADRRIFHNHTIAAQRERIRMRQERFRQHVHSMPPPIGIEPVTLADFAHMQGDRSLGWWGGGSTVTAGSSVAVSEDVLADPTQEYDKWAQAYRMLGGFIDCDHSKEEERHHSQDQDQNQNKDTVACSRWMMWASYVNPNYQGYEYKEYFGDSPYSKLDCHASDTEWKLLGVYRQEFYQYIEQISKHLWAIDDYEYVVALAGLAYMTDAVCWQIGATSDGAAIYAGVAPKPYGKFQMALYTDEYCLTPDDSLGLTFDDFGLTSDIDLGSKDATDDDGKSWAYDWWYGAQEYTLTSLNEVYEEYKYCTSCVDYPTYQDGYFIGDDGTDDDDLINQCWKFYSHDSFTCEAECIAMAHAQGTILSINYGDTTFGKTSSSFYSRSGRSTSSDNNLAESPLARLLANVFLTLAFLLFVATFLAFAVARRSRYRESRSKKSRRLLSGSSRSGRSASRKSRRSGDGIFRSSASPRRSSSRARSKPRSSSRRSSRRYEPPSSTLGADGGGAGDATH